MPVAAIDSGVLIDYKDTSPRARHERAGRIVHAVDLRRRLSASAGFEIVQSTQGEYHRATDLFETYGDLAFGDATIVAYMEREDLQYLYAFDDDFDALDGITRLATADDPFA